MFVIINGAPGSGKSTTAKLLFETIPQSAYVDGDTLLAINPEEKNDSTRQIRYKNIAATAKNYHESGYKHVFISFVYMKSADLNEQIELLKDTDEVKVFSLITDEDTLRQRHANDSATREPIESSIKLNESISTIEEGEKIDNSNMSIDDTAALIRNKLGLSHDDHP